MDFEVTVKHAQSSVAFNSMVIIVCRGRHCLEQTMSSILHDSNLMIVEGHDL